MGLLPLCKVVCDLLLNDRIKGERELLISSWGGTGRTTAQNPTLSWAVDFLLHALCSMDIILAVIHMRQFKRL